MFFTLLFSFLAKWSKTLILLVEACWEFLVGELVSVILWIAYRYSLFYSPLLGRCNFCIPWEMIYTKLYGKLWCNNWIFIYLLFADQLNVHFRQGELICFLYSEGMAHMQGPMQFIMRYWVFSSVVWEHIHLHLIGSTKFCRMISKCKHIPKFWSQELLEI